MERSHHARPMLLPRAVNITTILPRELWDMVLQLLSPSAWKCLRLVCKLLSKVVAHPLFETVRFELTSAGCSSLIAISSHLELSPLVKRLCLHRTRGLRKFPNYYVWKQSVDVFASSPKSSPLISGFEADRNSGIVAFYGWPALSDKQKWALFCQYNNDRSAIREETTTMISTIESNIQDEQVGQSSISQQKARSDVLRAMAALTSLSSFKHIPRSAQSNRCGLLRWRQLRFRPASFDAHTNRAEDHDMDALQLSAVLHLLGVLSPSLPRLCALQFHISGPAFWGHRRFRLLRIAQDHSLLRKRRLVCLATATTDRVVAGSRTPRFREKQASQMMTHAMDNITSLECSIGDGMEEGALTTVTRSLAKLLRNASGLATLRLKLDTVFDRALTSEDLLNAGGDSASPLLAILAQQKPWALLRKMTLTLVTDRYTLIEFLRVHHRTLRSLTLSRVALVFREGEELEPGTWESTLVDMTRIMALEDLVLSRLGDVSRADEGTVKRARILFDPDDPLWGGDLETYQAYHEKIVSSLLRKEIVGNLI